MNSEDTSIKEGEVADVKKRKAVDPTKRQPIVSGRMPLLFVHAIRYNETVKNMTKSQVAQLFGTTVGKVHDIVEERNFKYLNDKYKPTAEDFASAGVWAKSIGQSNKHGLTSLGDAKYLESLLEEYKGNGVATPDETAVQSAKPKRVSNKKGKDSVTTAEVSAEDLLS